MIPYSLASAAIMGLLHSAMYSDVWQVGGLWGAEVQSGGLVINGAVPSSLFHNANVNLKILEVLYNMDVKIHSNELKKKTW